MKFKNGETNMTRQQEREETFLMLCEYGFDTDRFGDPLSNSRGQRGSLPQTRRGLTLLSQLCRRGCLL